MATFEAAMREETEISGQLPLMEDYYTIQGEGRHAGLPAYFLRLGGCDVGCHWCDVKESWDKEKHPDTSIDEMVRRVEESGAKQAVITGGEPLMYNLDVLTRKLHDKEIKVFMETSGAYSLTGDWDWICLSPKKFKAPLDSIYPFVHELKVVVFHISDLEWAEQHAARVGDKTELFLQPEWSKEQKILPEIIEYVKKHPKWRISLQTHKYMQIP